MNTVSGSEVFGPENSVVDTATLQVEELQRWFPQRKGFFDLLRGGKSWIKAVDGVNFGLKEGQVLGIIGESGCGKSTMGRVLVGLDEPTGGRVHFKGIEARELLKTNPLAFRRKAQIVFQNPFDTFDSRHTIESILMEPLRIHGIGLNESSRREIVEEALAHASLSPARDYLRRYPHELSGGQLQRIAIIRSMLLKPLFLVADEPVSMLDVSVRAEILNTLLALVERESTAIVFISHDIAVTKYVSNRIGVMYLGRIVEMGEADEIVEHPVHPYTQALISNVPSRDPLDRNIGIEIEGEPPTPIDPGPGCYFAPRCPAASKDCFKAYPKASTVGKAHIVFCHRAK